jgi:hypothetical protein
MPLTCPYCNAPVPVSNPLPANGKVNCPRCEETVTVGNASPSEAAIAPSASSVDSPNLTNRTIAGLVVAVMLGMAALGLAIALQTVGIRRANDAKGVQPPELPEPKSVPPAAWPGLGYLPGDVQAVAGIRIADALDSPAGRTLLNALGLPDIKNGSILGIPPRDVDHLLFGTGLRTLPPRVTAVIHGSLGDAATSSRMTEQHGKTLHRLKLWPTGPEGAIWRPDRRTLVAALLPEDFDHVTAQPRTTIPLSELITDRLDPAALAWLVANVDANSPAFALAMPYLPPADRDVWTKLVALTVSVRADGDKLALTVQLRGRNAAAGEAITKVLADSLTKWGAIAMRRPESREQTGQWQQLTATADADQLTNWLQRR